MRLLSLVWKVFALLFVVAIPFAAIGYALARLPGAAVGVGSWWFMLLFAGLRAERGILRIYRVGREAPEGVSRSLGRVVAEIGGTAPRVLSFCDPAPQALVVRGPFSFGTILLSEGLLGALTEAELREVLAASVRRARSRGVVLQSLCAWSAHQILELAPRAWVELMFGELRWHESLGALGALRFATVYTAARFFTGLGKTQNDAPRGLSRLPRVAGEVVNPGSVILHFTAQWSDRALLSL